MRFDHTIKIAFSSFKGGAGKTACTIGLSYSLSKLGYSVLVVDTDSQGNCSDNLLTVVGINGQWEGLTISQLIDGKKTLYDAVFERDKYRSIDDYITNTKYDNLDLLAGDNRLSKKTSELVTQMASFNFVYKKMLDEICDLKKYDFIILDSSPSASGENLQIYAGVDYVIIPTETCVRYTDAIDRVYKSIDSINCVRIEPQISVLGIIINQVDIRTSIAKTVLPHLREEYGATVFKTIIPIDETVKQAEQLTVPVGVYMPKGRASRAYDEFTKEVLDRI